MFEVSSGAILIAIISIGIVILIGTVVSITTAFSMLNLCKFLKEYFRSSANEYGTLKERLKALQTRQERQHSLLVDLFGMMDDASNLNLTADEISRKIRAKLLATGMIRAKE